MSRANSISAVDALGTFIDTLRDLGYTPDEVKGALILYASPMPASPPRGMTPLTEEQVAPWPDFVGQAIRHGDRLVHPENGDEFVAVRLKGFNSDGDAWRAIYDDATVSRLCLQIGDKGRAVLAPSGSKEASNGHD